MKTYLIRQNEDSIVWLGKTSPTYLSRTVMVPPGTWIHSWGTIRWAQKFSETEKETQTLPQGTHWEEAL